MERNLSLCFVLVFLVPFSTLSCVNAEVTDISTDKQALLALKARISDDPSNILTKNWSTTTSVCSWTGIACAGRHHRVTTLNISNLGLTGTLPPQLGNLSFLATLAIWNNNFYGSLPEELAHLRRLKLLRLSKNRLSGELPESIFDNLPHLELLYLSFNMLQGKIPSTLSKCKKLQYLALGFNYFTGAIPKEIGNLTQLRWMHIDQNKLQGEIPGELGNCTQLEILDLWNNQLTGTIPKEIGNLTWLGELDLSYNKLQGEIPNEIGNHHKLQVLLLGFNNLVGLVPTTVFNISTMVVLGITQNKLRGMILPSNIEFPNLEGLYLGANDFSGTFPNFITNLSKLSNLDIAGNSFSGFIPITIGNLRNLEWLVLSDNFLTSSTPNLSFLSSLTNCNNLKYLLVEGNPLNGILPSSIGNLSTSLTNVHMNDCNISGNIPKEIKNLNNLIDIQLQNNELIGSIPVTLGGLQKLQGLNLGNNKLEGSIPDHLCHLNQLVDLKLYGNKIYGSIPACLGNLNTLRTLSLAFNRLTSIIPSTLWQLKDILHFNLSSNFLNGSLPLEIQNLKVVVDIDLSKNFLFGNIPIIIGNLKNLQNLSLGSNRFQGQIPESFGDLISLVFLDLSNNNLFGVIPKSLEKLLFLKYLNLSFNRLSGEIPTRGSFGNFSAESFVGNLALCGSPQLQVSPCRKSTHRKSRTKKALLPIILTLSIMFTLVALLLTFVLIKCLKKPTKPSTDADILPQETWRRISQHELVRATDGFSENNLLGRGSYGSVYKGRLEDGMELAVKVFHLHLEGAFTSFEAECEVMSRIRHRNLVKIISSCSNDDFKSLILEYMPNGSLEKCLYSDNNILDISHRLTIMIDVASALEYLHFGYSNPIIHCDLKPSNVLLDENMVAHLSDFGIAKLLGEEDSMTQTQTLATIGYMAPEHGREGKVSRKGDVYSYGIMLMEIFTRKKPTDEIFTEEMSLRSWVSSYLERVG